MIKEQFLLDPEGHVKDWLNLMVTQGERDDLERCAKTLSLDKNSIRQWGYRDKENQHAYLWRAIMLSICMKDNRILEHWSEMVGQELHPKGTGKELERLRKQEAEMKRVLGVEE